MNRYTADMLIPIVEKSQSFSDVARAVISKRNKSGFCQYCYRKRKQ